MISNIIIDISLTNEKAKILIAEIGNKSIEGFSLNPMKGIKGEFFTTEREKDLLDLCDFLIREKELVH